MSQFNSTYLGRKVVVEYSSADDPHESLEGVVIIYSDTGDQIDYDNMPDNEWSRLQEEVMAAFSEWQIESAMDLRWQ